MKTIFYSQILSKKLSSWTIILCFALAGFVQIPNTAHPQDGDEKSLMPSDDGLRGVYYGDVEQNTKQDKVGRLAVELLEGSESSIVRVDHPFRTGDKFRFQVSSNRDGWLYILHRSTSKELRLLWPRQAGDNEDEYLDMNRIKASQTYAIPPSPGLFIFDGKVGKEFFYAVIADEKKTPQFTATGMIRSEVIASTDNSGRSKQIVNFGVRSGSMKTAKSLRGVVYDPGRKDDDPFLYFSSPDNADNQHIFVEFQLKHQE